MPVDVRDLTGVVSQMSFGARSAPSLEVPHRLESSRSVDPRVRADGRRVLLVCSTGGHLTQLYRLKPWWDRRERLWVTFDNDHARSLLAGELVAWGHHPTTRNAGNLIRNLGVAFRVLTRYRPDIVISNGAGLAVPFFIEARAMGIPTVYIEVIDRIDSPTLTGRMCYPLSDLFLLQWEEQRRIYPRGVVVGRLL
jgi:beta-1,4-N-acetylglucosaminyltransferase